MLAGKNDLDFDPVDHRNINRHNYTHAEIEAETQRPVVKRLLDMMRLRNTCPAFDGPLEIADTEDSVLDLRRSHGDAWARLEADLRTCEFSITYGDGSETHTF